MERNVTIVTHRGGADLEGALTRAMLASAQMATRDYRMAGFARPFKRDGWFNHLFRAGEDSFLSLCEGLAVVHPDRLRPADLLAIDCVACLKIFTDGIQP